MRQETLVFNWKVFISDFASSSSDLFTKNSFSDVTLVSDDQIQFQAHKFVLSACSPVMKTMLENNTHSHPLIYLKGVSHQELQSILQFMYLGEVTVYSNHVDAFLDIANNLEIKKISQLETKTYNRPNETDNNDIERATVHEISSDKIIVKNEDQTEHPEITTSKDAENKEFIFFF